MTKRAYKKKYKKTGEDILMSDPEVYRAVLSNIIRYGKAIVRTNSNGVVTSVDY